MKCLAGVTWNKQVSDRDKWRRLEKAFVLQWPQIETDDDEED